MNNPQFPHLALAVDEQQFVARLWHALQSSGHIIAREHLQNAMAMTDRSFAPLPPQPVLTS